MTTVPDMDELRGRGMGNLLADLRGRGYSVGVHNDYSLHGQRMTFWLLTHPDGWHVKGEGPSDAEALAQCRAAADGWLPITERLQLALSLEERCRRLEEALRPFADAEEGTPDQVRAARALTEGKEDTNG